MESEEDNTIIEEGGKTRNLVCGTEKGRHVTKNYKTAGKTFQTGNFETLYVTALNSGFFTYSQSW